MTSRVDITTSDDWQIPATAEQLQSVPAMTGKELREVMKSQEYKTSSRCRELVQESIRRWGVTEDVATDFAGNEIEETQASDMIQAKKATVTAMFKDPRYKHDAAYRLEVQQKLANLTSQDQHERDFNPGATNQSLAVGFSPYAHSGSSLEVRRFARVELPMTETGADAPVKKTVKEAFSE